MNNADRHPRVSGYFRRAYDFDADGERFDLGYLEEVVVVFDQSRHLTWEATVDRDGLASVTVSGRDINQLALRSMSIRSLRSIATRFARTMEAESEAPGAHLDDALTEATANADQYARSRERPTMEAFAEAWHAATKHARRMELSHQFNVAPVTIDKWVRKARDQGLLPPPAAGRLRTKTSPPHDDGATPTNERSGA